MNELRKNAVSSGAERPGCARGPCGRPARPARSPVLPVAKGTSASLERRWAPARHACHKDEARRRLGVASPFRRGVRSSTSGTPATAGLTGRGLHPGTAPFTSETGRRQSPQHHKRLRHALPAPHPARRPAPPFRQRPRLLLFLALPVSLAQQDTSQCSVTGLSLMPVAPRTRLFPVSC